MSSLRQLPGLGIRTFIPVLLVTWTEGLAWGIVFAWPHRISGSHRVGPNAGGHADGVAHRHRAGVYRPSGPRHGGPPDPATSRSADGAPGRRGSAHQRPERPRVRDRLGQELDRNRPLSPPLVADVHGPRQTSKSSRHPRHRPATPCCGWWPMPTRARRCGRPTSSGGSAATSLRC